MDTQTHLHAVHFALVALQRQTVNFSPFGVRQDVHLIRLSFSPVNFLFKNCTWSNICNEEKFGKGSYVRGVNALYNNMADDQK